MFFVLGNLALYRALGDFAFKKNDKKRAEEQIVTGKMNVCLYVSSVLNYELNYKTLSLIDLSNFYPPLPADGF